MRHLTYSMSMSLDGYIVGPDGGFDWSAPDDEIFAFATDEVRRLDTHVMGRRLYEAMRYWESPENEPSFNAAEQEFADLWKQLDKVVFSRSLASVEGTSTRLATGSLEDELARLKAAPGGKGIAIGGGTLAAQAADLDLIDEYRVRVYPVLVGGGTPFFARTERRANLKLEETRTFASSVVYLGYRVLR
jgi:dihydrofolate reductase